MSNIKRVVCSICKTEVNKAQTYHVGNGNRACKSHEGVSEKKDSLQKIQTQKVQNAVKTAERREERHSHSNEWVDFEPGKLSCSLCRNKGIRSDQFFTKVLIEKSKAEQIYGVFNPFDMSHPGNQIKIADRCIFVLGKEKLAPVLKFIHGDFKQVLDLVGAAGICGPCCKQNKIDPMPKIEFDEVLKFAASKITSRVV